MATPARRIPRTGGRTVRAGRRRPFDLRATALFFGLLAIVVCVLGFAARAAADALERRPAWAVALCLVAAATALALRRRRRRFSARRTAQQAAAALEEAAMAALDELERETPEGQARAAAAPPQPARTAVPTAVVAPGPAAGGPVVEDTVVIQDPAVVDDTVLVEDTVVLPDAPAAPPGAEAPVDYDALDADAFEQAVAALCRRDGCVDVEVVGGAGDLGADVLAVAPDGRRVVVQCKRYCDSNRVGSQDLQRFGGTCYTVHEADVAVVVTTSDFTAPAAEYAAQCGIVCVDGQALRAWSDGTGPEPWRMPAAAEEPRC
ncbi:restriction endonuclease [Streptomyces sp. NPDC046831]|uniref:restriction endonuclease n=1 Tax=Streptomyces sp. NPDC046831 TaxID=3154805 RepID=UPI0034108BA3